MRHEGLIMIPSFSLPVNRGKVPEFPKQECAFMHSLSVALLGSLNEHDKLGIRFKFTKFAGELFHGIHMVHGR